jgi:hypothetical protein
MQKATLCRMALSVGAWRADLNLRRYGDLQSPPIGRSGMQNYSAPDRADASDSRHASDV